MARSVKDTNLGKRESRLRLPAGTRHWRSIHDGLAIGYRRGKQGSGVWSVRIRLSDGKYTIRPVGIADDHSEATGAGILNFTQAQKHALSVEEQVKREQGLSSGPITVGEASLYYMTWFKQHRKSINETSTVINAHILPYFENRQVADLTAKEIREWLEALASQPARKRAPAGLKTAKHRPAPETYDEKRPRRATANRILTILKAILNKAFHDELVADNTPWKRVKPFANVNEPSVRFLKEAECIRLVDACRPDFRKLVKAALFIGARYGELVRLQVTM